MLPEIEDILFATDLSENAAEAIRYAASIAVKYKARVTILHVIPDTFNTLSSIAGDRLEKHYPRKQWEDQNHERFIAAQKAVYERIQEICEELKKENPGSSIAMDNIIIEKGHPVERIVALAVDGGYDLVVMGTSGHGKFGDLMLGSVASGVVRRCPKPVLVVRLQR